MDVRLPGVGQLLFAAPLPAPFAGPVNASDPNNNGGQGPVVVTWPAGNDDAIVHLFLKPNHHAPLGFSECVLDSGATTVTASEAMVAPLRLVTGFEGGTATRAFVGKVEIAGGCVDVTIGHSELINVGP